jgi:hypothetical protein
MTVAQESYKANTDEQATTKQEQAQKREARYLRRAQRDRSDPMDMVMILPYIMVPPNELREMMRTAREEAEAAEQRNVRDRVEGWIRQVNA